MRCRGAGARGGSEGKEPHGPPIWRRAGEGRVDPGKDSLLRGCLVLTGPGGKGHPVPLDDGVRGGGRGGNFSTWAGALLPYVALLTVSACEKENSGKGRVRSR